MVAGLEDGDLIAERLDAEPNPAVEVRECLPDGTEFKAVWSHLRQSGVAKLGRVAVGIAPHGSHRSGLAQLRHPARQVTGSLRTASRAWEAVAAEGPPAVG